MAKKTSGDAKGHPVEGLGPELGPTFDALCEDLCWLQVVWGEYRELFGTSEERVELLNSTAGFFFRMLQIVLQEAIILHICRLTEKKRSRLTIWRLPKLCRNQSLRVKVGSLVENAVRATEFARDPRNRIIAHNALEVALGNATPPAMPSREQISLGLRAIHEVLNHISETLLKTTLLDRVLPPHTGSLALLQVLRDGLATS